MSLRGVERSAALCALWRAKVVQLAVGCDTRAARLELPGVRFFEVDTRRVAEFRERWMPPAAVQLGVDLAKPEHLSPTLVGAGFDVHCPTAWICEGLLEYHDPCFGERLFAALPQGAEQQLVLTVLDINWLRFLEKEHAQKPVRMAWRPSRLPALAWHRALLKRQGWRLQQALSELRPAAPQAAAPEADSLFHLLVASRGEKEEMRAAGWALPEKGFGSTFLFPSRQGPLGWLPRWPRRPGSPWPPGPAWPQRCRAFAGKAWALEVETGPRF
ncbi:unnamed protein product [Effrenium voratum]|nr:unnamed protein product [Effrenium voratum]